MVYTVVMHGLHYMHAQWYKSTDSILAADPAVAALQMIQLWDGYLQSKLTSSDEVLRMLVNFTLLASKYLLVKEAVTVGDSLMVQAIYNQYLLVFVHLNKNIYVDIILDQIDEHYGRIPYYVL